MRRIFPVFIIFAVLFFAMNDATINSSAIPLQTSEDTALTLLKSDILAMEPGSEEFVDLKTLAVVTSFPSVKNNSKIRIQASVSNTGDEDLQLREFIVGLNNDSDEEIQRFFKDYPQITAIREILSPRETKTDRVEGIINFPDLEGNYHFTIIFRYILLSNTSNILEARLPKNVSIDVFQPEPPPPVFIIWGIGFFSSVLVMMFALGFYGNRKKRIATFEAAKK